MREGLFRPTVSVIALASSLALYTPAFARDASSDTPANTYIHIEPTEAQDQQSAPTPNPPVAGQAVINDGPKEPSADSSLADIVVTANRKEERLQDVGIAITAVTGAQLNARGITNAGDVAAATPNFQMIRSFATPGFNTQITIRGIGQPNFEDTTESTAPTYVDDFYMIGAGQADFGLYDLARTEVARGPQGTVQGRNSTAGSVNFYTNRPDFNSTSAAVSVTGGEHSLFRSTGHLNLPISEMLAIRGSYSVDRNDGYTRNINPERLYDRGGQNKFFAGRFQLAFRPTDRVTLNLKAEFGLVGPTAAGNERALFTAPGPGIGTIEVPQDAYGNTQANMGTDRDIDTVNADGAMAARNRVNHYLANLNYEVTDNFSLVAVGGIMNMYKWSIEDCDHTPDPICLFTNEGRSKHQMVEVRGLYTKGGTTLTVGGSYLHQNLNITSVTPLFFNAATTPFVDENGDPTGLYAQSYRDHQTLKSYAFFGQIEQELSEQFKVIVGARYTHDDKVIDALNQVSTNVPLTFRVPRTLAEFDAIGDYAFANPDVTTALNVRDNGDLARFRKGLISANVQVNYKPSNDVLLYAAYRRGTKSGGFITGNTSGVDPSIRKYRDETNNAYEVGFKSTILGGAARLNGAAFYYDYANMQNTSFIGITNVVTNNDATVYGGELELASSPLEGLEVSGGIGLIHTKVNDITNPTGAVIATRDVKLPMAPTFSGNAMVRYKFDVAGGKAFAQIDGRTSTSMYRDSLNNVSTLIPGSSVVNGRIGFGNIDDDWNIALWVNNLLDSRKPINKFDLSGTGNSGELVYQMPRWVGATLSLKFGN